MIGTLRFQNGSLKLHKNKTGPATWYFRFYEEREDRRVYRKQRIGTVKDFPNRRDAEKAVLPLRAKINSGVRSPETVNDLIAHYERNELNILRSCVRNHFGETKTEASRRAVPLHPEVLSVMLIWRAESKFTADTDFLFPSLRLNGEKPLSPDSILKKCIRPALKKAGITGKQIGWHNFRHSFATNLVALGVDPKTAQELLRHTNIRTTLNIYTRAISQQKRDANEKLMAVLGEAAMAAQQPPAP